MEYICLFGEKATSIECSIIKHPIKQLIQTLREKVQRFGRVGEGLWRPPADTGEEESRTGGSLREAEAARLAEEEMQGEAVEGRSTRQGGGGGGADSSKQWRQGAQDRSNSKKRRGNAGGRAE
ncbi:hypothetical protein ACLOJK_021381 [Asimina triloba]